MQTYTFMEWDKISSSSVKQIQKFGFSHSLEKCEDGLPNTVQQLRKQPKK